MKNHAVPAERMLFIGSSVADVILHTPALPQTGDDINLASQQVMLGGCACNAFRISRLCGGKAALFSPIGQGVWGDYVRSHLAKEGVTSLCPAAHAPNGCCYCLVEPSGERTFLCDHGAEYRFLPEWFGILRDEVFHSAYICGLEIEESTGDAILDYLKQHPPHQLYFAPGPRICHIQPGKMASILAMEPVLHLNGDELLRFTRTASLEEGVNKLLSLTPCTLVVTLGEQGAYYADDHQQFFVPGVETEVVDTIGAGDAHVGALMAARWRGNDWEASLRSANAVAAATVSIPGAGLTMDQLQRWFLRHPDSEKNFMDF